MQGFRIGSKGYGRGLRLPDYRGDEPVAALRDGLDISRLLRSIPQGLAQLDDDLGEGVVAHQHAGPNG